MISHINRAIQQHNDDVMFYFIFLCDDTGSMGGFIESMNCTLKQLIPIVRLLLKGEAEVRVFTYNEHGAAQVLKQEYGINGNLNQFLQSLEASGGSFPGEASKAGFNAVWQSVQTDIDAGTAVKTFVFHYGDDFPHCQATRMRYPREFAQEKAYVEGNDGIFDWKLLVQKFKELQISVYNILRPQHDSLVAFYGMMGPVIVLKESDSDTVTKASIGVLLNILGQDLGFDGSEQFNLVNFDHYSAEDCVEAMEQGNVVSDFFSTQGGFKYSPCSEFHIPQAIELQGQTIQLDLLVKESASYRTLVYNIIIHFLDSGFTSVLSYNAVLVKLCCLFLEHGAYEHTRALREKLRAQIHNIGGEGRQQLEACL